MSEKDIQVDYNTSLQPLADLLAKIERGGDYFHAGARETPMPGLRVEEAGLLSFPVPPEQAKRLIAVAAERAPYGRGDRTLIDESVRKVWQVAPDKVAISGQGWQTALEEVVEECAHGLGCDPKKTGAEFYKLLVYDTGGFFAAHRDTEKSAGMFGTLVISLPSAHEGGELLIRHAGREKTVDLRSTAPSEIRYAAFYADCEHEVRPVTKGYRVCLVYNLVQKKGKNSPATPDHRPETAAAVKILQSWADSDEKPDKLVYLLEHQYTQASLSFAGLKNSDAARARILQEAAARTGCAVHLGIVHIEESGWAEYNGDYHHYRRRWDEDEEEEDSSEFEIGEVCDGRYFIDQWRNAADEEVTFGEIPLQDEEILPAEALDGEEPDEEHFSEATGNEGASFERTYLRAAVVLWPEQRFDEICLSAGIDAAIARLGQYVETARITKGPAPAKAGAQARRFAAKLPLEWEPYGDHSKRLDALLRHLARFGDAELLERIGSGPSIRGYDARLNPALLLCAKALGPGRSEGFFTELMAARGATHPGGCLTLWTALAGKFPKESRLLAGLSTTLREQFATCKPWKRPRPANEAPPRWSWSNRDDEEFEELITGLTPKETGTQPTPEVLVKFLAAQQETLGSRACLTAAEAFGGNLAAFPPKPLLLPALEQLSQGTPSVEPPVLVALWEMCAAFYLKRSSSPPPKPKDWKQDVQIPGTDPLLRELEAFARDPREQVHRFRVRKDLRQTLHRAIDKARLDMTHVTERGGSPQTLVCTKTRATHEKACAQYQSDLADMRWLLELPQAQTSPGPSEKLRQALRTTE